MEREDGLIYCGDPSDYFAPYRRWPATERRAMRYVRGLVLDVGCGSGRVALHLQERGFDVLAIDESPGAVEVARRRGVRRAEVCGLADLDESLGLFDTVLIVRNNLGLAGSGAAAKRTLRRLGSLTTPHGLIITDSVDPARIDDPALRPLAGRTQRFRVRWQTYATPWFRYVMTAPGAFAELVSGTGWSVAALIDDGSPRYGVVLEKAPTGGR